jgi:hypothetical protein
MKSLKVRAHIRAGQVDECQQAFSDCVTRFLKLGIPVTKASDYCLPLMDECKEKSDEDA